MIERCISGELDRLRGEEIHKSMTDDCTPEFKDKPMIFETSKNSVALRVHHHLTAYFHPLSWETCWMLFVTSSPKSLLLSVISDSVLVPLLEMNGKTDFFLPQSSRLSWISDLRKSLSLCLCRERTSWWVVGPWVWTDLWNTEAKGPCFLEKYLKEMAAEACPQNASRPRPKDVPEPVTMFLPW